MIIMALSRALRLSASVSLCGCSCSCVATATATQIATRTAVAACAAGSRPLGTCGIMVCVTVGIMTAIMTAIVMSPLAGYRLSAPLSLDRGAAWESITMTTEPAMTARPTARLTQGADVVELALLPNSGLVMIMTTKAATDAVMLDLCRDFPA